MSIDMKACFVVPAISDNDTKHILWGYIPHGHEYHNSKTIAALKWRGKCSIFISSGIHASEQGVLIVIGNPFGF